MQVIDRIQREVKKLPVEFQIEVLSYIQYLLDIANQKEQTHEISEWANFSLDQAMRGMEDEEPLLG